jgi:hypothetical protein
MKTLSLAILLCCACTHYGYKILKMNSTGHSASFKCRAEGDSEVCEWKDGSGCLHVLTSAGNVWIEYPGCK